MTQRNLRLLIGIIVVAVIATYIAIPNSPGIHIHQGPIDVDQDFPIHEGLDLVGGVQVLLAADVPPGQTVDPDRMQAALGIVEQRVNALGVSEPLVQQAQGNRIIVELPDVKDPDQAVKTFGQTGLLEFVDAGSSYLPPGTVITTSLGGPSSTTGVTNTLSAAGATAGITGTNGITATGAVSPTNGVTATNGVTPTTGTASTGTTPSSPFAGQVFKTIMQGNDLANASVGFTQVNQPQINFSLSSNGAKIFADYTTKNVGKYLAITMDKTVIECPVIQQPITGGNGVINGQFTLAQAQSLVIQLKYGSLPIPLKVVQDQTVGATLGQDSVRRSLIAGIIGLAIVAGFMLINYRLPGLLAVIALLIYTAVAFALFKLIPVTLTVAGIAGFILSIGMAVDANILIFERMKEELRAGRTMRAAEEVGFRRAFPSIRDSNVSTLITCAILYWFGLTFSASIIQGFALTLAIGVIVSLISATFVTQTFLQIAIGIGATSERWFYGLHRPAPAGEGARP